jgi:hypothetical protein
MHPMFTALTYFDQVRHHKAAAEPALQWYRAVIYYWSNARHAWHFTLVEHYWGATAFQLSLEEAKDAVERKRVQGSWFHIAPLPVLVVEGTAHAVVIAEVNNSSPLLGLGAPHYNKALTLGDVARYFKPPVARTILPLVVDNHVTFDRGMNRLHYRSSSRGNKYRLSWKPITGYGYDQGPVVDIVRTLDAGRKRWECDYGAAGREEKGAV